MSFLIASVTAVILCVAIAQNGRADEPLTFEQAQTRTAYAHEQVDAARNRLGEIERKEKAAYRALDEAQRRYDEAKANAERMTQARRAAEAEVEAAQQRWAEESARLQRIYKENQERRRAR